MRGVTLGGSCHEYGGQSRDGEVGAKEGAVFPSCPLPPPLSHTHSVSAGCAQGPGFGP